MEDRPSADGHSIRGAFRQLNCMDVSERVSGLVRYAMNGHLSRYVLLCVALTDG